MDSPLFTLHASPVQRMREYSHPQPVIRTRARPAAADKL